MNATFLKTLGKLRVYGIINPNTSETGIERDGNNVFVTGPTNKEVVDYVYHFKKYPFLTSVFHLFANNPTYKSLKREQLKTMNFKFREVFSNAYYGECIGIDSEFCTNTEPLLGSLYVPIGGKLKKVSEWTGPENTSLNDVFIMDKAMSEHALLSIKLSGATIVGASDLIQPELLDREVYLSLDLVELLNSKARIIMVLNETNDTEPTPNVKGIKPYKGPLRVVVKN